MAGILANSASVTMVAADADDATAGFITAEQVTCTTTPSGSAYDWALAKPAGSTARSALSDDDTASVSFTPDVAGYYVLTCTVDSTTAYVHRLAVTQVAASTSQEALRFSPKTDASIPTPGVGAAIFYSSDDSRLAAKTSAGTVQALRPYAYTPTGSADAEGATGDVAFDNSYLYVKAAGGWRRVAVAAF